MKLGILLLLVGAWVSMQMVAKRQMSKLKYNLLSIEIPEGTPRYLDEKGVRKMVEAYVPNWQSLYVDSLHLDALETRLEKATAIKRAEVFLRTSGDNLKFVNCLVVRVFQREPAVRVITSKDNYYMDCEGVRIDVNSTYTAKVPVVTGAVNEKYMQKELLPFVLYINSNDFWSAQIKDISVDSYGELSIVPLIGSQIIRFGPPTRYQEKLRNLRALYEQGFSKLGWDKYKTIDLKYRGQVVCEYK